MNNDLVEQVLNKYLLPGDDYIFGFADMSHLLHDGLKEFRYGISIGKRLDNKIVNGILSGPTIEYYRHYREINVELARITQNIAADLKIAGIEAICVEPTVTTHELDHVYADDLTFPVSHKMVATRAGLGWIGKSDLFISKAFGPRLRLVSMLTKGPLDIESEPIESSRCGKCKICMDRCPAGAINGKLWDVSVNRDEFFDAFKCRAKCKELGEKYLGMDVAVCGICVAVCPFGW